MTGCRLWPKAVRSTGGVVTSASAYRTASNASDSPYSPPAIPPAAAAAISRLEQAVRTIAARVIWPAARHTAMYRDFGTAAG